LAFVFAGDYTTLETTPRLSRSAPVRDQTIAAPKALSTETLIALFFAPGKIS